MRCFFLVLTYRNFCIILLIFINFLWRFFHFLLFCGFLGVNYASSQPVY